MLQIISQNYVVWNIIELNTQYLKDELQIISQNYVVWNNSPEYLSAVVLHVANYITKLRGLKHEITTTIQGNEMRCKLYHKTTWFETLSFS